MKFTGEAQKPYWKNSATISILVKAVSEQHPGLLNYRALETGIVFIDHPQSLSPVIKKPQRSHTHEEILSGGELWEEMRFPRSLEESIWELTLHKKGGRSLCDKKQAVPPRQGTNSIDSPHVAI